MTKVYEHKFPTYVNKIIKTSRFNEFIFGTWSGIKIARVNKDYSLIEDGKE